MMRKSVEDVDDIIGIGSDLGISEGYDCKLHYALPGNEDEMEYSGNDLSDKMVLELADIAIERW